MKNAESNKDKLLEIRKITVCRKVFSSYNYHPIMWQMVKEKRIQGRR
jgi:hypothetical protein